MIYTLENEALRVKVATYGAELQSIYSKATEKEYIWQPGAELWDNHSILLFPTPGRIAHDRTIIGGKVYPATMHGFAKDMEFTAVKASRVKLVLDLASNEETRFFLPYEFIFRVSFELRGEVLEQKLEVINKDDKTVYFSVGAHPGFYCPIELGETGDDYVLDFDRPQNIKELVGEENTRLLTHKEKEWLCGKEKPLSDHFFDNGPCLLGNVNADTITLRSKKSGHFIEMGIKDFPYMCLWGLGTKMQIFCIEPWCGMSDYTDTDHIWEHRIGIEHADAGDTFTRVLTFRVG
ncbi:MAG: aldose 1-epimerase family protein [Clostridia bacterium]|nr:aldose 1-epimerase family protein [Clostridia bacterium]